MDTSDYLHSVTEFFRGRGWNTSTTEIRNGVYIVAGSQNRDDSPLRMLAMIVDEPEKQITIDHVKYLIKAGRKKDANKIFLTGSATISSEAQSIVDKYNIQLLDPDTVSDKSDVGLEIDTDRITIPEPDENNASQTDVSSSQNSGVETIDSTENEKNEDIQSIKENIIEIYEKSDESLLLWIPGFKKDNDFLNIVFIFIYSFTFPISFPALYYIYRKRNNPDYKLSHLFSSLPGIAPVNSRRRNVIIGSGYATLGSSMVLGGLLSVSEEEPTDELDSTEESDPESIVSNWLVERESIEQESINELFDGLFLYDDGEIWSAAVTLRSSFQTFEGLKEETADERDNYSNDSRERELFNLVVEVYEAWEQAAGNAHLAAVAHNDDNFVEAENYWNAHETWIDRVPARVDAVNSELNDFEYEVDVDEIIDGI